MRHFRFVMFFLMIIGVGLPVAGADVFNVKVYGATGNGTTDDGAAILAAAAALKLNGGGTLFFPRGNYLTFGPSTTYRSLGFFVNLTDLNIQCEGCTITVSSDHVMSEPWGYLFEMAGCRNVKVDGFNVVGPATATDIRATAVKGVTFVHLYPGNSDVELGNNRVSGLMAGLTSYNQDGSGNPTGVTNRNIYVRHLEVTNSWYGMNGQFGPENMTIEVLKTDTTHRSLLLYGSKNVKAVVHSKDPWHDDVLLDSRAIAPGYGNEDVQLRYIRRGDTSNAGGGGGVVLKFPPSSPSVAFRNIEIDLNVKYPGAGTTAGESTVLFRKGDNSAYGHKLENLRISGYIENYPDTAGFPLIGNDPNYAWPAGDLWQNISIQDLLIVNGITSRLILGPLVGSVTLTNVKSNADFALVQSLSTLIPPSAGQYVIVNSSFPNLYSSTPDHPAGALEYLITGGLSGGFHSIPTGWRGHTITDRGAGGHVQHTLPTCSQTTIGVEFTFARTTPYMFFIDPAGSQTIRGGGAGKFLSLNYVGNSVRLRCTTEGIWDIVHEEGWNSPEP
jgi:hypothetical protein